MLILTANLQEYFQEKVEDAMQRFQSSLSEELQAYLVWLLCDFSRSDRVYAGTNAQEQPILVLLLERALEAPTSEANRIFKQIGDSTLYLSGFFGEKAQAAGVSRQYYFALGEQAYYLLAQNTRVPVYHELSDAFEHLVFLLRHVSLTHKTANSEQILSWIEEYRQFKSPELYTLLMQHGVFLKDDDPTC